MKTTPQQNGIAKALIGMARSLSSGKFLKFKSVKIYTRANFVGKFNCDIDESVEIVLMGPCGDYYPCYTVAFFLKKLDYLINRDYFNFSKKGAF